jgi:hypothetical protein
VDRAWALRRVRWPANAFLVLAVFQLAIGLLATAAEVAVWSGVPAEVAYDPFDWGDDESYGETTDTGTRLTEILCVLVASLYAMFGLSRMKRLQSFNHATAAVVVMMIPPTSPCCCIGIFFGMWAWHVLYDRRVRAAFR